MNMSRHDCLFIKPDACMPLTQYPCDCTIPLDLLLMILLFFPPYHLRPLPRLTQLLLFRSRQLFQYFLPTLNLWQLNTIIRRQFPAQFRFLFSIYYFLLMSSFIKSIFEMFYAVSQPV